MIEEGRFIEFVTKAFSFLTTEFQFSQTNKIVYGNTFYEIEFTDDKTKVISISLENIENHLKVMIFTLDKGKVSDYDDNSKTFSLSRLNDKFLKTLTKEQFESNNEYFQDLKGKDEFEKQIVKSAKDLRLCLSQIDKL